MYVRMYVCMYVHIMCMYVCMYVLCMYVCMYACMYLLGLNLERNPVEVSTKVLSPSCGPPILSCGAGVEEEEGGWSLVMGGGTSAVGSLSSLCSSPTSRSSSGSALWEGLILSGVSKVSVEGMRPEDAGLNV